MGLGAWLDAADLNRVVRLCSESHQYVAAATERFWSWLDLSRLPHPVEFFASASKSAHFGGVAFLTLQFCDVLRDAHLAALPPAVRWLKLDACSNLTDAGVKTISMACGKRLELISLYCCPRLSTSSALALSIRCPSLTSISFSGDKQVEAAGILALASRCRKLRELNLTRLPLVDDTALETLAQNNPDLRTLRLYADSQLGDASLLKVAQRCASLHTLDCTGLRSLSDSTVVALGEHCHELRELLLTWVVNVTDAGACAIARGCRRLRTLSLHGIKGVGATSLDALVEHCALTLVALDVRGCIGLAEEERSPVQLVRRLTRLVTFALAT